MESVDDESETTWTAAEALALVSPFFSKEWRETTAKETNLQRVTGGFCNRLHLLTRNNATPADREPASILIRHFGNSSGVTTQEPLHSEGGSVTTLSAAEQAVVYYEMGRRGWGPKIYGLFPGGRLEEYITSHPLTAAESTQAPIRRDVARSYARLHSLRTLPLRKRNLERVVEELGRGVERRDEVSGKLMEVGSPGAVEFAVVVRETDWKGELEWVSSLFSEHECGEAVVVGDTNFLNVLVKEFESECGVVLIDYETAGYSYRGVDIGGHFTDRMYCWTRPGSKMTGYSAADVDERRLFCASYLQEMRDLNHGLEMTRESDTVEHLLLESEIGQMYQILWSVLMCKIFDEVPEDGDLLAGLAHMMGVYRGLKRDFTTRRL